MFHMLLHFVLPLIIALAFFRTRWKTAYLIMMATMLVDIDHLLATPIYDPLRCSIGFHPLHRLVPIGIYIVLSLIPKTRLVGLGLVIHMALDSVDCKVNTGEWIHQSISYLNTALMRDNKKARQPELTCFLESQ